MPTASIYSLTSTSKLDFDSVIYTFACQRGLEPKKKMQTSFSPVMNREYQAFQDLMNIAESNLILRPWAFGSGVNKTQPQT